MFEPAILAETAAYIATYKPPFMHSAPLKREKSGGTLLDWCAALFPEILAVKGKNPWEGGIVHRLDYETRGLLLFARTQAAMDALLAQQEKGLFVKEYRAVAARPPSPSGSSLPGFPPKPFSLSPEGPLPLVIESAFRPYGPGRKAVRPIARNGEGEAGGGKSALLNRPRLYQTEVAEFNIIEETFTFRLRIKRGFRHQIRCHLAWLGCPILNDPLYGGASDNGPLALCAEALSFHDPESGALCRVASPWQ